MQTIIINYLVQFTLTLIGQNPITWGCILMGAFV